MKNRVIRKDRYVFFLFQRFPASCAHVVLRLLIYCLYCTMIKIHAHISRILAASTHNEHTHECGVFVFNRSVAVQNRSDKHGDEDVNLYFVLQS